jgi:alpha-glucuronidase
VLQRLVYQEGHAIVWRDAVVNWFYKISGIPDSQGGVGRNINRVEAEAMQLSGYAPVDVTPRDTASGGKAIACVGQTSCSATFSFGSDAGQFDVSIQYFDQSNGASRYELLINNQLVDSWRSADHLPSDRMNGHTSTRHTVASLNLRPGDTVKISGYPDGGEPAPLDYIEFEGTRRASAPPGNHSVN